MPDSDITHQPITHEGGINKKSKAEQRFSIQSEQGSILAIVMLVMVVGLLLLSGLQRQLDSQLKLGIDEQRFWQAFNLAMSSLNWGMSLRWPPDNEWQCQSMAARALSACLHIPKSQPVADDNRLAASGNSRMGLLRGEGRLDGSAEPLVVYHRVAVQIQHSAVQIQPLVGGWLDVCPESEESVCAPAR
ncbi:MULTISPECIES: YgdB family protein [Dickeya]|uniref:Probable membrane protein YPO1016 n=1 Tax=Dickeya aquatica TaxID=1401087 RepID=A0A375AE29_9GAMM|nr:MULTISPECIES: YgdB family protein [Dickeya]SLM64166.1 probable membrane protein YPO1016 [Dickeya aquatica]